MEKLHWKKDIFGNRLEIKRGDEPIGRIRWTNFLSSKAQAAFNGKLFTLKRDFLSSKLEIFDANDNSLLAIVIINLFQPKNDVVVNGKRFELDFKNFLQSRWSWKFNGSEIISYTTNEFVLKEKGVIELFASCNEEIEILILLGLFVRNQFILILLIIILILFLIII